MRTKYQVKIFTTHRGRYRVIVKMNTNDRGFKMVMMDDFPIRLQSLPFKERQYLDAYPEGSLGITARNMIKIGMSKGMNKDAQQFCERAFKQEQKETNE